MKRLLLILIMLSVWATAYAETWNVEFKNTTDVKVIYIFNWIDHPYDHPYPINLAGGELDPGKSHRPEYDYLPGEYMVTWIIGDEKYIYAFSHRNYMDRLRILTPYNE